MPNSIIIDEAIHPDTHHKDLRRIVAIAIDEHSAEYVFDWAVNNFIHPATDLVIFLNCRQIEGPVAPIINPSGFIEEFDDKKKNKSHQLLMKYADQLKAQNIAVRAIALAGEPKNEIIRKVTELKADVLLIGSRQLGAVKRALLGSVSDYCGHSSPCTTIIVKAHPEHPEGKHNYKSIFHRHMHDQ